MSLVTRLYFVKNQFYPTNGKSNQINAHIATVPVGSLKRKLGVHFIVMDAPSQDLMKKSNV